MGAGGKIRTEHEAESRHLAIARECEGLPCATGKLQSPAGVEHPAWSGLALLTSAGATAAATSMQQNTAYVLSCIHFSHVSNHLTHTIA